MADNGCCPDNGIDVTIDYSTYSASAKSFLERHGIISAYRSPMPRMSPYQLKIHRLPLVPPLPLPPFAEQLNGEPPPDQGQTLEWPHPVSFDSDA